MQTLTVRVKPKGNTFLPWQWLIDFSLPDTFASMAAAKAEKYADSAVGNVTGSNSVNVFLGLGLPWLIAVIYEGSTDYGEDERFYYVPAGALGFSVIVFVACATICIIFLLIRRVTVKGELGGSSNRCPREKVRASCCPSLARAAASAAFP